MWPFHKHRWVEVGREALMRSAFGALRLPEEWPMGFPETLITERCVDQSCRKWRQKTLAGHLLGATTSEQAKEGDEVVQ